MTVTLEQRMDAIERKVAALAEGLVQPSRRTKDWRATFGLSKDDPEFAEMIRLGQAYRKGTALDDCARS